MLHLSGMTGQCNKKEGDGSMKQCPQCCDMALYDDTLDVCPLCKTSLTPYIRSRTQTQREEMNFVSEPKTQYYTASRESSVVRPGHAQSQVNGRTENKVPQFERCEGRQHVFRGTVTEINVQTRYYNRFHKVVNTFFRGEPYQFGNTSHESVIRVEEFHNGRLASQHRDLVVYGDIEGLIQIGDDVTAWTRKRDGRYTVQRLYSDETDAFITAGPQLSAWVIAVMMGLAILFIAGLIAAIVTFIQNGGILYLFSALAGLIFGLIMHFLPQLLVIGGFLWILKMFLFGRK